MSEKMISDNVASTTQTTKNALTPINPWLVESWNLTKKVVMPFVGLSILQMLVALGILLGTLLLGGVVLVLFGLGNAADIQAAFSGNTEMIPQVLSSMAGGIAVAVALFFAVILVISSAFQAAMLHLMANHEKGATVGQSFKFGFTKIWPVLLTSLIVLFLVLGGTIFFIIPGIIISLFVMFASYEVVLSDKKPMDAIRSSTGMVSQYFWDIVGRLVLIWLISFFYSLLWMSVDEIVKATLGEVPALVALLALVRMVAEILFTVFTIALSVTLYRQLKQVADPKKSVSLTWAWITAGIGWLFIVLFAVSMVNAARNNLDSLEDMSGIEEASESAEFDQWLQEQVQE